MGFLKSGLRVKIVGQPTHNREIKGHFPVQETIDGVVI
jgi:hypothetical protein